ncbi:hypothetical protein GCM10028864_12080 [Microlunatus parietis]
MQNRATRPVGLNGVHLTTRPLWISAATDRLKFTPVVGLGYGPGRKIFGDGAYGSNSATPLIDRPKLTPTLTIGVRHSSRGQDAPQLLARQRRLGVERTSPTTQLVADLAGRRREGRWSGFGKNFKINNGRWVLTFVDGNLSRRGLQQYELAL